MHGILRGALLAALIAGSSFAQDDPIVAAPERASLLERLDVDLRAGVWVPRLNGQTGLAGDTIGLENGFDLGGSEVEPNVELTLRLDDRWQARVTWFQFSNDEDDVFESFATFGNLRLTPGRQYTSAIDIESFSIDVGFDVFTPHPRPRVGPRPRPAGPRPQGRAVLRHTLFAGARYLEVEQQVVLAGGASARGDGDWLVLGVGGEVRLDWAPASGLPYGHGIGMGVSAFVGGDVASDGGIFVEIRAGVRYSFTRNFGVAVGYRFFDTNVDDGAFTFDGGLRGLFLAGVLRF